MLTAAIDIGMHREIPNDDSEWNKKDIEGHRNVS
jgi:hypothetical protein